MRTTDVLEQLDDARLKIERALAGARAINRTPRVEMVGAIERVLPVLQAAIIETRNQIGREYEIVRVEKASSHERQD
jgi:hypothetical protein